MVDDYPSPQPGDLFGTDVHVVDLTNDGYGEILIGAPGRDVGPDQKAGVFFIRIGPNNPSNANWVEVPEPGATGPNPKGEFGYRLDHGDFNGDGEIDVVVSCPGARLNAHDVDNGAVAILFGPWNMGSTPPYSNSVVITEPATDWNDATHTFGDRFGHRLAVGRINDDGLDDLIVGAPRSNVPPPNGDQQAGQAWVFWGDALAGVNPAPVELIHPDDPARRNDRLWGWDVAIGDVVDEAGYSGYNDAIVAAYNIDPGNAGDVTVFRDYPVTLMFDRFNRVLEQGGPQNLSCFGWAIDAGDFNGDAYHDLAIGAPGGPFGSPGGVHIYAGGSAFPNSAQNKNFDAPGAGSSGNFGSELVWLDLDDDGVDELAIGGPTFDAPPPGGDPSKGEGRVWTREIVNPPSWVVIDDPVPESSSDLNGFGVSLASGQINLNNEVDLVIGCPKSKQLHR